MCPLVALSLSLEALVEKGLVTMVMMKELVMMVMVKVLKDL